MTRLSRLRLPLVSLAVVALAACVPEAAQNPPTGAEDYADYCSACHGPAGKGDGGAAKSLSKAPADLTQLTRKNGGTFPGTRVMAQIWGYAGAKGRGVMPDFGPMLTGQLVPFDGGDGIQTPTPIRLVQLAEYLKTLQAK